MATIAKRTRRRTTTTLLQFGCRTRGNAGEDRKAAPCGAILGNVDDLRTSIRRSCDRPVKLNKPITTTAASGSSDDNNIMLHPSRTWVLVVGICDEWPGERSILGDVALRQAFLDYHVPSNRVEFVCDDKATASNAQSRLVDILRRIPERNSLVLYYGGHGEKARFCTRDGNVCGDENRKTKRKYWYHSDVVNAIEKYAPEGTSVWILADCCQSGTFRTAVENYQRPQQNECKKENEATVKVTKGNTRVSYFCIMSTEGIAEAGADWTLTECWIRAMLGQWGNLNMNDLLGLLSDEIARVKGDRMDAYLHIGQESRCFLDVRIPNKETGMFLGCDDIAYISFMMRPVFLLDGIVSKGHTLYDFSSTECSPQLRSSSSSSSSSQPYSSLSWSGVSSCNVGDAVYARWRGGYVSRRSGVHAVEKWLPPFIPPLWFPATVLSIRGDPEDSNKGDGIGKATVRVEIHDPSTAITWLADVDRRHLLENAHFALRPALRDAQGALATNQKFVSPSPPAGTHVRAMWTDGHRYDATVMSIFDVPWTEVAKKEERQAAAERTEKIHCRRRRRCAVEGANGDCGRGSYENLPGAYVPVQWNGEDTYSLVPKRCCRRVTSRQHQ